MYDFGKVEKEILSFWKENRIFEKSLALRQAQDKKHFVFFEGPPTANGRPGIHHFLGRALKDLFCRYKTMHGFYVLRKAGWDTHGLPVELEVEKELGFKNKKDIEKYGIAEFNKKAKESVWKYKTEWEEMTKRMGYWLDMSDPYITYKSQYIESLWAIIKKIWDRKLLYLAHRVVPFCTRCGTPLSSHEVAQGYKTVTDKSVYVKFKLKPNNKFSENSYILVWTTTPWTLPGNVALAVGKDIDYVIAEKEGENYILAKDLVENVLGPDTGSDISIFKNVKSFKGSDLVGLEYEPLFDVKELKSEKSYKIYDADFVSTEEGTGVVHAAVMYGEDDYNLGTKLGLPKYHTVDEQGRFINVSDVLDGQYVKDPATEDLIIRELEIRNLLLKVENFEHDYPFCWRCETPLLYYAKESWFIKMSAVNKQLLKNNEKINWIPEHIKKGRFGQWLKEGKDWAFSRERYWGTPLPVWHCQNCKNYLVAGSLDDLERHRHKPKNEFYTLRHGNSTKNGYGSKAAIISSKLEYDKYVLTDEGKKQVKEAAKKLKKLGIDTVIASPFLRTKETAEMVSNELGVKVIFDERAREFDHGFACEGKTEHVCGMGDDREWESKTADGESWKDLKRRMSLFVRDINAKYRGKKILIVSHGDPLWLLESFTLNLTGQEAIDKYGELFSKEAEVRKIDLKNYPYDENGDLDMHRPYIDDISLKCDKCGSEIRKIPDLIDVWFDSGAMPYAQWHWPFKETRDKRQETSKIDNKKMFKEQFPADFISEAIDQTRGWFYTLLSVATLLGKEPPYKNVLVYSHVLDEKGQKMSKSKGNVVSPFEVMDKFGADAARWYFYTINSPEDYKLFSMKDVGQRFAGFITTLDNCVRFYELYGDGSGAFTHNSKADHLLDKWILSKLNGLVAETTGYLDNYDSTSSARAIEKFVIDNLSNWWLRRSRKRKDALGLLRFALLELAKVIAPFTPFIAEDIHKRLHRGYNMGTESVHIHDWPKMNKKLVDKKLEEEMEKVREIITAGLALRREKNIKVRQPLAKLVISEWRIVNREWQNQLIDLIKEELNVKEVIFDESQKEDVVLDTELTQPLIHEGYARELMRQIQDMRKEVKYRLDDKIFGQWHSDDKDTSDAIREWSEEIKKDVLLSEFHNGPHDGRAYDVEKEFELASQRKIWMGLRK